MQAAFPMKDQGAVRPLYADGPCLCGMAEAGLSGMGCVWTDAPGHPRSAVMAVGDFILCGGEAGLSAARLLRTALRSDQREWLVYAPGAWMEALRRTAVFHLETRWGFDHHVQPEDSALRQRLAQLPEGASMVPLAGEWIARCRKESWSRDFVHEFPTDAAYQADGLGTLLMMGDTAVAGASSYLAYPGGIELQVQTRDGFEGRGYATLAASALILMAHARGLIATWDAANAASAHMAEQLGYRPTGAYAIAVIDR